MDITRATAATAADGGHPARWFVVKTKPREESRCAAELARVGIETLCPRIKEYRLRRKQVEKVPLFPGYIFARFSYPDNYYSVKWARGVKDLVRFGEGPPATLEESTVNFFTNRMDAEGLVDLDPGLKPGDPVMFRTEPFRGLVGTILRADSAKGRILVLMELMYQARVEVDSYQLQAL
jgi:transcriptional antiterminator RfaH